MAPTAAAFREDWPAAETIDLFDQSLYVDYQRAGEVTPAITVRIASLIRYSAGCGADAVLFTGSLFGDSVTRARADLEIPVLGAYEAMIQQAFQQGSRFLLLATVADTLDLLRSDIEHYARQQGQVCTIESRHVEGALTALFEGNQTAHDRLIVEAANTAPPCDALLLGQFSMAPVAKQIPAVPGRVILTSPNTAVAMLRAMFSDE